ncbi:MAG: UDP-N-acetylmuramoyl-tripeptide--D-alanyl-D-alanine ligase, partial [Pseudomonadota bacterium]|nr:UDP-N-acetylmuramoyl-tripeptide--D-alanyl-D-alanine ligase [Pseudomonadota bacterium]
MIKSLDLNELLTVVAGRTDASQLSQDITRVSTDTRTLGPGSLYVPLKGERFDGHAFAEQAKAAGAVAMLAEQPLNTESLETSEFPVIYVDSTLRALADLAAWHRDQFDGAVVAVTGSAGKTTVKNLMGSVLSQTFNTLITQGNLNNHIGAPLTLLSLEPEHQAAMIELGASGLGEIEYTARLARPQVGILTNVVPAHLEGFGSVDNIARTKGEIIDCTDLNGTVILNVDDVYFPQWQARAGQRRITTFGFSDTADVRAINIEETVSGCRFTCVSPEFTADISLALPGRHNVRNALAVIAAAQALNLSQSAIVTGLESARPVAGRLQACAGRRGETLLNDAYNANP